MQSSSQNPAIRVTARSTSNWAEWWRAEAERVGTDWPSVIAAHFAIADLLRRAPS
jgi:hypothetical protein